MSYEFDNMSSQQQRRPGAALVPNCMNDEIAGLLARVDTDVRSQRVKVSDAVDRLEELYEAGGVSKADAEYLFKTRKGAIKKWAKLALAEIEAAADGDAETD